MKDPKNVTQTPSGGAPAGDGFFDKESAVPPAEARIPEPPVVGTTPPGVPGLVHVDPSTQPAVAGVSAPDLKPGETVPVVDDGRKTPEEWAHELGHVDAAAIVADGVDGTPAPRRGPLRRRPITEAKGWIFAAVKRYAGWGTKLPIDTRLTRPEYEEAVSEMLGTPLERGREPIAKARPGDPETPKQERALKWRADIVIANAAEASKAGGER